MALSGNKPDMEKFGELGLTVGVALLVAAYLRFTMQGDWEKLSKGLLIAGGILILAGVVVNAKRLMGFFSKRSSQLGTNTTLLALGVLAILAVANYLGAKYHKRFDLTTEKAFTLSDQTKKVVGGLTKDVNVVRFAKGNDGASVQFNDLLTEYKSLSPHIKYQSVDPDQKPEIVKDYGAQHMGDIVVAAGERKETLPAMGGLTEEDLTSTILKVTKDKTRNICFITGHGEKSTADTGASGYSTVIAGVKKEGYTTRDINLVQENGVPADCDVVVDAGPTKEFFPQEVPMLSKYLDGGGKALLMIDPQTDPKLNDVLSAWNITANDNVVIDASGVGRLMGAGPAIPMVVDYGDSPITKTLQGQVTFFPLARTITEADKSKTTPIETDLIKTSARSFTVPKIEKQVTFDPKTAGPLTLGIAATGKENDANARLVVIGDSDFASNQGVSGAGSNSDFFYNTIDWLAQDENQISIRPKEQTDSHIVMTEAQRSALVWIDMIFLPGIVIVSGISIWWRRR
jgi:ABC-type uncharacterized transport system involved in gliding motility auxiliary subunit